MRADDVIRDAESAGDIAAARHLFEEYAASIGVDLCFQHFAEELAGLPGEYSPPRGCLLIATHGAQPVGCAALRALPGDDAIGEVKRLYVQPRGRGTGLGRRLAQAVIERARSIGYRELKLDTLERMVDARRLYEGVGFRRCAPYYVNPLPDVVYMALPL